MLVRRNLSFLSLLTLIVILPICAASLARAQGITDSVLRMNSTISKVRDRLVIERLYEFGTEIDFTLKTGEAAKLVLNENPYDLVEILLCPIEGDFHVIHLGEFGCITSGYAPMKFNSSYSGGWEEVTFIASWEIEGDRFHVKYRLKSEEKKAKGPSSKMPPTVTTLTKAERILGLVTVYHMAKQHFAYFDQVPDLNWDQAFVDYLPLAEEQNNLYEYYRILQRFTALLQDGHTQVYFPDSIWDNLDGLPLWLDFIEDQWVVIERYTTQEILQEDIPPGSIIESIEGLPPGEYFEKNFFPYISAGNLERKHTVLNWEGKFPQNTKIQIKFRYPDNTMHSRILRANRRTVKWTKDMREKHQESIHREPYFSYKSLPGNILYVRYGRCLRRYESWFAELIVNSRLRWPKALILDLRGNGGGSTPTNVAQCLISKPIKQFQFKTRYSISYIDAHLQPQSKKGGELEQFFEQRKSRYGLGERFSANWYTPSFSEREIEPCGIHYDGPLVILIDGYTVSAAEDLVVLLQGNGRGTVIGEKSSGTTGQPLFFDLPGGGSCRICTANCRFPDGRQFVGPGIQPDIPVERTIKGIAEGKDEILDVALEFVQQKWGEMNSGEKDN